MLRRCTPTSTPSRSEPSVEGADDLRHEPLEHFLSRGRGRTHEPVRHDELVELLAAYRSTGFDEFIVPDWFMGPTATARQEMLERFMTEVVSALD